MQLLEKQLALQRTAYGVDPSSLHGEELVDYVRMNALAAIVELTEMLTEVDGWKSWQTEREEAGEFRSDATGEKYAKEGVDVLHFVGNLLNVLPWMDDGALEQLFDAKQKENLARQREGYAGIGEEFRPADPAALMEYDRQGTMP